MITDFVYYLMKFSWILKLFRANDAHIRGIRVDFSQQKYSMVCVLKNSFQNFCLQNLS